MAWRGRAPVLRRARDRQRRLRPGGRCVRRACRRARGARGERIAPVVQLREGAGRDPGGVQRGRFARAPRGRRLEVEPRDRRPEPRDGAHVGGADRDPLARGARRRVHPRKRGLPSRAVRRRFAEAPAPGRRPHGPRDHEGAARGVRGEHRYGAREEPAPLARAARARLACSLRRARRRRRHRRPRSRRPLLQGGGGARRAVHEPSRRDGRGDADRARARRRRRATSTRCSTTRTAVRGRRTCRATRSRRPRARTAPCC